LHAIIKASGPTVSVCRQDFYLSLLFYHRKLRCLIAAARP
jgi:predicted nuclease of restriction endonuclease-like (RecB) superfamily